MHRGGFIGAQIAQHGLDEAPVDPGGWIDAAIMRGVDIVLAFPEVVLAILVAAMLGRDPGATLGALASVPGFLIWKAMMIPRTLIAARANAAWVRTARNSESKGPKA